MARTTKEQALKTQEKIVETAIDLFFTHGVSQTTLESIAEAAGLTRGAIYWHFKNKLDLFNAIHDKFHTSVVEIIFEEVKPTVSCPLGQLREVSEKFLVQLQNDEQRQRILTIFTMKCDYSGEMAGFTEERIKKRDLCIAQFTTYFTAAISQNQLPDDTNPDFLARALLSYICGITSEYLRDKTIFDFKNDARALIALFFDRMPAPGNFLQECESPSSRQ